MKKIRREHSVNGYITLYFKGHPIMGTCRMYEHRYKMMKHLKRKLRAREVVHHKDGNSKNNRISNLELWSSNGAHLREHFKGRKQPRHIAEAARRYMLNLPPEERRKRGVKGGSNSGPGLKRRLAKLTKAQRRERMRPAIEAWKAKARAKKSLHVVSPQSQRFYGV